MRHFKRIMIAVAGGSVFALGVAMLVLPGPAFLMIPAGLAILAVEFAWARRWLRSARAVLPWRGPGRPGPSKPTMKSVRRSVEFLWRRVRQTFRGKKKYAACRFPA